MERPDTKIAPLTRTERAITIRNTAVDEELDVSQLLRLSPTSVYFPFHRYQHLYFLAVYSLTTLFWVFLKDYQYLLRRDLGPYRNIVHPKGELAKLLIMKAIYYVLVIVLPLVLLDITWWQFLIGFLTMHFTAGLILSLVFQLAHVIEGPVQFAAEGKFGQMVALRGTKMLPVPISEAVGGLRTVPLDHPLIRAGRAGGASFGD